MKALLMVEPGAALDSFAKPEAEQAADTREIDRLEPKKVG